MTEPPFISSTPFDFPNITQNPYNNITTREICVIEMSLGNRILIAAFTIIFCLSVSGNGLVIVTIVQQRWMRSVTNLYLLNLAVSDLLLVSICMPVTLLGLLLKCFLFGSVFCKIVTFLQPVSVTASAYTLAIIALERFFAICRPLQSRHWKTRSHAGKMILLTWIFSFLVNAVSLFIFRLELTSVGSKNCTFAGWFRAHTFIYSVCVAVVLFIIPLLAMLGLYGSVIRTLWAGIQIEKQHSSAVNGQIDCDDDCLTPNRKRKTFRWKSRKKDERLTLNNNGNCSSAITRRPRDFVLRNNQMEKTLIAKKRVVRMLMAIVIIFFICWMPLYVFYILYHGKFLGRFSIISYQVFVTLSYLSTCTNPICYCFFNRKFRQAFLLAFGCRRFVDANFIGGNTTNAFHTETKRKSSSMQPTSTMRRSASNDAERVLDTMVKSDLKRNSLFPGYRKETGI